MPEKETEGSAPSGEAAGRGDAPTSTSTSEGESARQAENAKINEKISEKASTCFICALYHNCVKPSIITGGTGIGIHKLAIRIVCVKIVSLKIGA